MRGREPYVAGTTPATAEIQVSPDGRIITYSTGRIEKFDANHTLIERTSQGKTQSIAEDHRLRWMPPGRDFRSSRVVTEITPAAQSCGPGLAKMVYEAVPREGSYKLMIAGKEAAVKSIEFHLNGKWTAGSCGTGKQVRKIIYSPDLDIVLESEVLNYYPDGIFLFFGNGARLKSIN